MYVGGYTSLGRERVDSMYSRIGFNAPSKHGVNAVCTRKDFLFSTTKLVRSGLLGYVGTVLFFLLRMSNNKYQRREDLLVGGRR